MHRKGIIKLAADVYFGIKKIAVDKGKFESYGDLLERCNEVYEITAKQSEQVSKENNITALIKLATKLKAVDKELLYLAISSISKNLASDRSQLLSFNEYVTRHMKLVRYKK